MSTRILIDSDRAEDWADLRARVMDAIVPRDGTIREVLTRLAWHLPQKVFCTSAEDVRAVLDCIERDTDLVMPLTEYRLFAVFPHGSLELGEGEAWQVRRDLAHLTPPAQLTKEEVAAWAARWDR